MASDDGREIAARRTDYAPKDWLEVIKRLGGNVTTHVERLDTTIESLKTIDAWMKANTSSEPIVVAATDGQGEDHVFATQGGKVVDTYSNGKVIDYPGPVERLANQRVYPVHIVS